MPCDESLRLLREYEAAVSKWSRLTEYSTTMDLKALAAALRRAAIDAKKAYADHRAAHGC